MASSRGSLPYGTDFILGFCHIRKICDIRGDASLPSLVNTTLVCVVSVYISLPIIISSSIYYNKLYHNSFIRLHGFVLALVLVVTEAEIPNNCSASQPTSTRNFFLQK